MTKIDRLLQRKERLAKEVEQLKERLLQKQEELKGLDKEILEQTMQDNDIDVQDLVNLIQKQKGTE